MDPPKDYLPDNWLVFCAFGPACTELYGVGFQCINEFILTKADPKTKTRTDIKDEDGKKKFVERPLTAVEREELGVVHDSNMVGALTAEIAAQQAQLTAAMGMPAAAYEGGETEQWADVRALRASLAKKCEELQNLRRSAEVAKNRIGETRLPAPTATAVAGPDSDGQRPNTVHL